MSQLVSLVFGSSPQQRIRLQRTMLASGICCMMLFVHIFEVRSGLMAKGSALKLTMFCLCGIFGFYLMIRTALNRRFGKGSSLTLPQQIFATATVLWTYAIAGSDRGAVIGLLVLILMFGVFAFRPRIMMGLAIGTLVALAAIMFGQYQISPVTYPRAVLIGQFSYAALAIFPVCILSAQINKLQNTLRGKKAALELALEQIARLAESDDLTGLLNRRAMAEMMRSEMRTQKSTPGQICVALIDIDFFKSVNDKFGHQAGDEVLRIFAKVGKSSLRAGDMFARWGGEEFLLMLPDVTVAQAVECLERVRALLANTSFDAISPGLRVTVSSGVTDFHPEDTLETTVERADQAMYRAKQLGRDRVVLGKLRSNSVMDNMMVSS